MKTFLAALLAFAVPAFAELKIPKGVFRIAQYEEALKEAKAQKRPLAVVLNHEFTEGKGHEEASDEVFKAVTGWATVIFLDSEKKPLESEHLSPPFITALSEETNRILPMLIIGSPTEDIVWKVQSNAKGAGPKDVRRIFRAAVAEVKANVTAHFAAKTPAPMVQPGDKLLIWTLEKGEGFKGRFGKVEGENFHLKNEKGEFSQAIPLANLKPATARYAKLLAGLPAGDAAAPASKTAGKPGPEKWTNAKGVEIEATFVKLAGDKVTLRLASGKDSVLPLASLSAASQARAKELAAQNK